MLVAPRAFPIPKASVSFTHLNAIVVAAQVGVALFIGNSKGPRQPRQFDIFFIPVLIENVLERYAIIGLLLGIEPSSEIQVIVKVLGSKNENQTCCCPFCHLAGLSSAYSSRDTTVLEVTTS